MTHERAATGLAAGVPPVTRPMMTGLLAAAITTPSPRGAQPWRYRACLASQAIDLYADAERIRHCGNPGARAVHIACGAALLNLRLAAAAAGRQAVVRLLPDRQQPRLLATVRLGGPYRARRDVDELYAEIFRCGDDSRPSRVPATVLAELREVAWLEGAQLMLEPPGVLRPRSPGRGGWLRAGQALQRVLLTASARGVTAYVPGWACAGRYDAEARSADDQDRAVGEVDDLVRGAAEDQAGQIAAAAAAHDDDIHIVFPGRADDLPGGVTEHGVPGEAVRLDPRIGQQVHRSGDRLAGLAGGLVGGQRAGLGRRLTLQHVQHPHLCAGEDRQVPGRDQCTRRGA
jgi:hypothetical protein